MQRSALAGEHRLQSGLRPHGLQAVGGRRFQAPLLRRMKVNSCRASATSQPNQRSRRYGNETTEAVYTGRSQRRGRSFFLQGDRAERLRLPDQMPGRMRPRPLRRDLPLRRQARHVAVHGGAATCSLQTGGRR